MDNSVLSENLRGIANQIRERIERLTYSKRDRRALVLGGIGLFVLLAYVVFQFFSSRNEVLERRLKMLQEDLVKVESLKFEYIESRKKIEEITKSMTGGDEDLISLVEKALIGAGVERGNFSITSRSPSSGDMYDEMSVDVEINRISLGSLVEVLYSLQTRPSFLKISNFRIQTRFDNPDLIKASFRVSTFKFKRVI
ncbi:hypothetical protein HRbin37_02391 [bacterium HR37]|nr:hypothetical protein HRbin37_02391 [bacterium HR37]